MQQKAQFSKSKVSHLFRHRAGTYYAITKVGGNKFRRSLDTDDFNIAKTLPVDPMGLSITRVTLAELRSLMDKYAGRQWRHFTMALCPS